MTESHTFLNAEAKWAGQRHKEIANNVPAYRLRQGNRDNRSFIVAKSEPEMQYGTHKCKGQENVSPKKEMLSSHLFYYASLFLLGCDPHKVIEDYFGEQGLNPLAVVRSDVEPGALILKERDKIIFAESIFDYSTGQKPAVTTKELTSTELDRVLKKYEQDRRVIGSSAAGFLKSILPTKITTDLAFTGNVVKVDLRNVKANGLKSDDIQNYLSKNTSGLRNFIATQASASEPYVVYETYLADTLVISSESGTDVSTKVAVSGEFEALSSEDPSFSCSRASKETILIKANKPYLFAVRTARLLVRNGVYSLESTNFVPREMKTVGGGEQFSIPVLDGYSQMKLEPVKSPF